MMQRIDPTVLAFALALVIGLAVAWWLSRRRARSVRREWRPDVLDEGAAPAQRNQALIDAPLATPVNQIILPDAVAAFVSAPVSEPRDGDDLTRIKGLGPKLASLLATLDVTSFAQIAAWTDDDVARIDAQLGNFAGRPVRDAWVEQAKLLAAGDTSGFEGKFGKI